METKLKKTLNGGSSAKSAAPVNGSINKKKQLILSNSNDKKKAAATPLATKLAANQTNPRMIESYWKLSEYDQTTRMQGIAEIAKYFATLDPSANKESYNHVLMRLIKGLASNRKCSRLGYSLALTELIAQNESLSFDHVIDLANIHLTIAKRFTFLNAFCSFKYSINSEAITS
jgi:hypothetical protein